ncbi:hypothetical protein [Paraburkholderia kirstenboschensis]|uniref:Peptidase C80 domain-containing protein n=1 Tax=Paraburkholderia kirstenboschensis TaxID=1245436 RepID=A0ABZ0EBV8_9BURK|nr:hypothetical protein [Paraburkholderia kirstenboschensis]WOD14430.1 hypothetical protein RW095_02830 [Paraburkholderia kirstenboschensis]
MKVDRLLILYEAGKSKDKAGEVAPSANALLEKQLQRMSRLADELALSEGADAKAKGNGMTPAFLMPFESQNSKLRYLKDTKGKLEAADKAGKKTGGATDLTWGAYLILHGRGGREARGKTTVDKLAKLLKEAAPNGMGWKLKKVCIVACTLGAEPPEGTDSYVKQFCDTLKVTDALVGGYTVQVFVGYADHPASREAFAVPGNPKYADEKNRGHKLIAVPTDDLKRLGLKDDAQRLSDENFRANYKVAWRWNGKNSEQVDVMKDWYHH